jgi:hypothetical protein
MLNRRKLQKATAAIAPLMLAALACGPLGGGGGAGPTIAISSPASETAVTVGAEVAITSAATADAGVARVELSVNGQVVHTDAPPSGNPTSFSVVQTWTPAVEGEVTISVVAYDAQEQASEPAAITLRVVAVVAEVTPTAVEDVAAPGGCTLNASFVSDVTVPDDTEMAPGETFVKTWRMRNSGTCDWGPGFTLVFQNGDAMGGPGSVAVPATAAGSTADISVNLEAPAAPGTYRGNWRMQSDEGLAFGASAYVQIVVPEPATDTPVPPTEVPTGTPEPTSTSEPLVPWFPPLLVTMIPFLLPATEQVFDQVSVAPGSVGYATASCPDNTVAVGGGYAATSEMLVYTHSRYGNGWRAYAKNNANSDKYLNAYAICLSNTSGSATQDYNQISVAAGSVGHTYLSCPAGSVVTGGGYASPSGGQLFVYNSSKHGNGWQVYARNTSGSSELLNVYAVCLAGTSAVTEQVGDQVWVSAGATGSASATCGAGTLVTGGGFAANDGMLIYNTSMTPAGDQWRTYVKSNAGFTKLVSSYAICLSFP